MPKPLMKIGDRLLTLPRPVRRSITLRRKKIAEARRALRHYGHVLDALQQPPKVDELGRPDADDVAIKSALQQAAITDLLWAQAYIEHLLHFQTSGAFGDEWSTPTAVARRYRHNRMIDTPEETV